MKRKTPPKVDRECPVSQEVRLQVNDLVPSGRRLPRMTFKFISSTDMPAPQLQASTLKLEADPLRLFNEDAASLQARPRQTHTGDYEGEIQRRRLAERKTGMALACCV